MWELKAIAKTQSCNTNEVYKGNHIIYRGIIVGFSKGWMGQQKDWKSLSMDWNAFNNFIKHWRALNSQHKDKICIT